jgi:hypothetical protein
MGLHLHDVSDMCGIVWEVDDYCALINGYAPSKALAPNKHYKPYTTTNEHHP